ncbi:MAG: hypothetical protein R3231_10800, partial [bacterium]|nr:hypothetical protein [bacterium]
KYDAYLSLFPEGKYGDQGRQAIEVLQVESLKKQLSITDIEAFLTANPDSKFRGELEGLIAELTAKAEAAAKEKLEAQKRAKELAAAQAQLRRKRLIQFGGLGALLTLLAVAVVAFMKISARRKAAALLLAQLDDELGAEGDEAPELYETWEKGPVRYEDLLGIERNPESGALPGGDETKGIAGNTQPALPEPERAGPDDGDIHDGDGISPFMEDGPRGHDGTVIPLGVEEDPKPADSGEDEVIDLSDHETDFKLELEDIPEEGEQKNSRGPRNVGTQEFDPEDLDFSGILDGEGDETKRRRGGGQI